MNVNENIVEDAPSEISVPIKEEKIREFLQRKFKNLNFEKKKNSWSAWQGNETLHEKSSSGYQENLSNKVLEFLDNKPKNQNYIVKDLINNNCYNTFQEKITRKENKESTGILKGEIFRTEEWGKKNKILRKELLKFLGVTKIRKPVMRQIEEFRIIIIKNLKKS